MATIRRFEDLDAWQKARELVRFVYAYSGSGRFAKDFGLRDQIRRAAVSVMSNIAEGFERGGSSEFRQFLAIAKGSAGEVEAQLYVALDQGYITGDEFDEVKAFASSTKKLLAAFMNYLNRSNIKGSKYKQQPSTSNLTTRNQRPETKNQKPGTVTALSKNG